MRKTKSIIFLAAMVASVAMAAAPEGVTIRKALTEGVESYHADMKIDMNMTIAGQPQDSTITSKVHYSFKNGKPDSAKGNVPTELTTTIEKMEATGMMEMLLDQGKDKAMEPIVAKGTLSDRSRFAADLVQADATSLLAGSGSSALQIFVEFPQKSVSVGDTWDIVVPKSPLTGKDDQKLTAKYVGDKDLDGKPVYVLSLTGTLKTDADTSNLPKPEGATNGAASLLANAKVLIHGTSDIVEESLVDKATGKTLQTTMTVKAKQMIELPDMGDLKVDMTGKTTSTVTADK